MIAIFSSTIAKTPTLPLFASHLGATEAQVGWIAAASTIPGLFIGYLAGTLSDKYGWKRILSASLVIFATAPFIYLIVQTPIQLAAVRFYHGFATAAFGPVAMAAVALLYQERRGEMLSLYSSSTMLGRAVAPFAGGLLLASWSYSGVYYICALAGVLALVMGKVFYRGLHVENAFFSTEKELQADINIAANIRTILCNREFLLVGIIEATVFFAYGALEILFPLYARQQGLQVWQIGIVMGLQLSGAIFFKPVFGQLSDKIGRMPVIFSGLVLCAASIGGIPFWSGFLGTGLMNVFFGLGFALVTSSTRPLAAESVSCGKVGTSMGALSTLMDVGQAAGPPVVGIIAVLYGYRGGFLLMTAMLSMAFFICFYYFIRSRLYK